MCVVSVCVYSKINSEAFCGKHMNIHAHAHTKCILTPCMMCVRVCVHVRVFVRTFV